MQRDHLPKLAGIYKIVNKLTGAFYLGSSLNVYQRCGKHLSDLKLGKHHSKYLQRSFNKYGVDEFFFEFLEPCEIAFLTEREEVLIAELMPEYNSLTKPTNPSPHKKGFTGNYSTSQKTRWEDPEYRERQTKALREAHQSEESRSRQREASLKLHKERPELALKHSEYMRQIIENDPDYSKKLSERAIKSMRSTQVRAKFCALTDEEVVFVLQLKRDGHTNRTIAKIMDKKLHTIDDVSSGKTYKHINRETLEVDPDFYIQKD